MKETLGWDKVVSEFALQRLEETIDEVEKLREGGKVHIDILSKKVLEANKWFKDTAIDFETGEFNEELYETYKYRILVKGKTVYIVQGLEYDPHEGKFKRDQSNG